MSQSYVMSHNVCSVNVLGSIYDFRLCRSLITGNFWFTGKSGSRTYSSPVFTSSVFALENLSSFIWFIGGPVNLSDGQSDVAYLQELFSDVIFCQAEEVRQ